MKQTLINFTDDELKSLLRFTETLAGSTAADTEDLAQAKAQGSELAQRRNAGRAGRAYRDDSEEGQLIREQVKKFLRKRGKV